MYLKGGDIVQRSIVLAGLQSMGVWFPAHNSVTPVAVTPASGHMSQYSDLCE